MVVCFLARAPRSLAGGFLVAVAGCARFVVLLLCSCLVLKRLLQEWSCLSYHFLTCTMGSAPIKWTCTASFDFSGQDSWLTGPYWPLGRRGKKKESWKWTRFWNLSRENNLNQKNKLCWQDGSVCIQLLHLYSKIRFLCFKSRWPIRLRKAVLLVFSVFKAISNFMGWNLLAGSRGFWTGFKRCSKGFRGIGFRRRKLIFCS